MEVHFIWQLLDAVVDPEIPTLSITDLGIIREIRIDGQQIMPPEEWEEVNTTQNNPDLEKAQISIIITPTYSGCPAMHTIAADIKTALDQNGLTQAQIITTLSPPWTSDWLTTRGKQRLKAFGIAPPEEMTTDKSFLTGKKRGITCPFCQSKQTQLISQFGSTACKALYRCTDCLEPFDYFKCH